MDVDVTVLGKNEPGRFGDLTFPVPPRIVDRESYASRDAILDQTIQLECRAEGVPTPVVTWKKDGRVLLPQAERVESINNGTILRLHNVQLTEQARYTCVAVNKVGQAEADTFVTIKSMRYQVSTGIWFTFTHFQRHRSSRPTRNW
jgi:hypothetical protein